MDALSSSLSYRNFKLQDAASIVRCSFMMRRNICALDLSLLEFSVYKKHVVSSSQRNLLKALMGFFNTEEQIRKFLVRDRNILCTLHLDIPQGREPSLRNNEILDSVDFLVDPKSFHVGSIFIPDFWHEEKLQGFVIQSVYKSHHKLLTLSRILKNDGAMYNVEMPLYVMRYDLGVLCFEWNDSDSAKGVIIGFNIRETTLYAKRPKISQIHTFGGFQLQGKVHHEGCIIHELVLGCIFEFIPSLLEYGLSLKVSDAEYKQLKESIILLVDQDVKSISDTRIVCKEVHLIKRRYRFSTNSYGMYIQFVISVESSLKLMTGDDQILIKN
ncbi:hypothetical protein HNY73_018802 [Argiope bruennichi]|uniref:Uncharacterized protein n=1 Tax=Argiope bruennichi TaxID=94029 RepID=A0A8T0EEE2_ARGBR|nr:hypothetical protein HNY73_018802 [Argiope bruennichi]